MTLLTSMVTCALLALAFTRPARVGAQGRGPRTGRAKSRAAIRSPLAGLALALLAPLAVALAQTTAAPPAPAPGAPAVTARPSPAATPSAAPTAPTATGPAYEIEIVVFRAKVALGQPENWAAETTASATISGGETSSGSGPVGKLLSVLPASDYRLTSIVGRLRSSDAYVPLAHAAWVQTASAWGTRAGFPLQSLGIDVPGLSGVIFLERGQFLHLGMTLDYTLQDPPPGLNAAPGTTFVMNETRRVRFYERNYYDHPAFGVIALVTPARGPRPPGR
jgi:hypothetical protein